MKTSKVVPCAALFTVALLLTSCGGTSNGVGPDVPSRPLAARLEDEDNAFDKGMVQTGIVETLRKPGSYTLFVPDSDAFTRVLEEAGLTEEEFLQLENLEEILGYHVAIGIPDILDYKAEQEVETLAGPTLKLHATDTEHASVNDISLVSVLNDTTLNTNGEYEVIDGLLLPPGVSLP
jgi:uncharacterized surface protein with fasciclin (FAS1) repeats/predicted small secreted protein